MGYVLMSHQPSKFEIRFTLAAFILLFLLICALPAAAQQQPEETVSIPKSKLTTQQLQEIAQQNVQERVSQYGKWIGIGKEVGIAVNDGLSAVTKQANDFAETKVGKWTIFVIIFKVVGEKVVQYLVGLSMLFIGVIAWLWSYRRYLPKVAVLKKETFDVATGKVTSRDYGIYEGNREMVGWHYLCLVILIGIAICVMFVG